MKNLLIACSFIFGFQMSFGAEKEKHVDSKINEVTVYLQGAQIKRKAKIYVEKGVTKVIFDNVTQYFDPNNIQVKGVGNFIIMEVSHNVFYPAPTKVVSTGNIPLKILKEITFIEDSLSDYSWILKKLQSQLSVYKSEKTILLSSGVIKGQNENDSIPLLKEALTYYRVKLIEINKLILKTDQKIFQENKIVNRLNTRLRSLKNWKNKTQVPTQDLSPVQQIIVTVSADASTSGSLTLSYMTSQAGWSPSYDLRADNVGAPVKITYKAKVFQNTGKPWDNVKITLSTINPNRSNAKPVLAPWYINYYQPIQHVTTVNRNYNKINNGVAESAKGMPSISDEMTVSTKAKHVSNYTEMSSNMTMVEFKLKIAHSIPSDGKEHLMAVASKSIPATFEYFAVPKLEREAFLIAKLTGWEDLNLLPAVANIYYDGTYVGQTRIEPSSIRDTMELALGRDRRVVVQRKKVDTEEKIKKASGDKIVSLTYSIIVKNLNATNLTINVLDHIPLSSNEEIEIALLDKGKGYYNEKKGFLKWTFSLGAKMVKKLRYSYSLKYDKDKQIVI